jgi:hypothetical protein
MTQLCEAMLVDSSASYWIKDSLRSALERDPVDAFNDAETLVNALRENLDKALLQNEDTARQNHVGLWADSNPVALWDYRHNKGQWKN